MAYITEPKLSDFKKPKSAVQKKWPYSNNNSNHDDENAYRVQLH